MFTYLVEVYAGNSLHVFSLVITQQSKKGGLDR